MIDRLTVKKIKMPQLFLNGFLNLRLRLLQEHTKGMIRNNLKLDTYLN